MASYNGLLINQIELSNCAKAKALVDWIYWTQSTDEASTIATRNRITSAGRSPGVLKRILTQLTSVTCQGAKVSSIAPCVRDGELCSGHGSCPSGECVCASGWSGTFCDGISAQSPSAGLSFLKHDLIACATLQRKWDHRPAATQRRSLWRWDWAWGFRSS